MNRLTYYTTGDATRAPHYAAAPGARKDDFVQRLGEYEDTGLTPFGIAELKAGNAADLTDRHWNECRQIALYQNELSQALDLLSECYGALAALGKLAPSLPRDVQDYVEGLCIRIDSLREESARTTEVPADE